MKRVLVAGEINVDLILRASGALPALGKEILVDDAVLTLGSALVYVFQPGADLSQGLTAA